MNNRPSSSACKAAATRFKYVLGYPIDQVPSVERLKERKQQVAGIIAQVLVWSSLTLSGLGVIKVVYEAGGSSLSGSAILVVLLLTLNGVANFLRWTWYIEWIRKWPAVQWMVSVLFNGRIHRAEHDMLLYNSYVSQCHMENEYHRLVKRFNESNQSRARKPTSLDLATGNFGSNVLVVNFPPRNPE